MSSEFGKGLTYCLGLFLAHEWQYSKWEEDYARAGIKTDLAESWFNASSDHLYDLQDDQAPPRLRRRVGRFKSKCIRWGHGFGLPNLGKPTKEDVSWAIKEAKDLLRLIDKANGISTTKGDWE